MLSSHKRMTTCDSDILCDMAGIRAAQARVDPNPTNPHFRDRSSLRLNIQMETAPSKWKWVGCIYLFVCLFIINPLSQYWTLISFQFGIYKMMDYPLYEFKPTLPSITEQCVVHPWKHNLKYTVYDCTERNRSITIAIASFHLYPSKHELSRYEMMMLSNHIAYTMKHKYIYFDMNDLIFDDAHISSYFSSNIPSANAMFKSQKPFIIDAILNDTYYGNTIDYVMWIDFDAIFYNCSTSVQSVIDYTTHLYDNISEHYNSDHNTMDIIFSRDYFSLTNSGVIIYKNTKWTKRLLRKQMHVFAHADAFKFADIYTNVRDLVDQNIFNAFIMGFDPPLNEHKYLKNDRGYVALKYVLEKEKEMRALVPQWHDWGKCLDDAAQHVEIHDHYIGVHIRNKSAMIPQFYLNVLMTEWIYAGYYKTNKFPYDPMIVHFASLGKHYLRSPQFRTLKCSV
eukprot:59696_1